FDVPFDNVQLRNANLEEYVYGLPQEGTFAVKVLGPSDKIEKLELTGLRPYIDLSQYTEEGQYNAEIKFELEADYQMSDKYTMIVEVGLKDKEPEEGELPPEEGEEGAEGNESGEEGTPENGAGEEANGEIHSES
ncbi:MAG: hypothetical protein J6Z02_01200, partial [Lachnospiraceae bacterium]|nr:hypothetical protein [Lachnospiraceae bacterium]